MTAQAAAATVLLKTVFLNEGWELEYTELVD